ncbi:putative translation regulator (Cya5) [Aspergillus mulundensis]|uniref:PROP1-like PPR domain-containing protein n=1 Tax=Aspergillus mulundensis TaxID=1810919 RepID=A0A3D8T4T9_9EURO|nr:hypothetical protein DSM5745_00871 [Aspergillus mulundensis]RDW93549.1 hypothetical protein DSM5745_00871 [Aspergillus mulundensis]
MGQPVISEDVEGRSDSWARDSLMELLSKEGGILGQADRTWQLYMFAGQPLDLNKVLLAEYSKSENETDNARAKHLFLNIALESRSAEDYSNILKSHLATGQWGEVASVCQQTEANGHGFSGWAMALAHCIDRANWSVAQSLYEAVCPVDGFKLWDCILPLLDINLLSNNLPDLSLQLQSRVNNTVEEERTWPLFIKYMTSKILATSNLVETISTDALLRLLRDYHSAGFLTHNQFWNLIKTLQSSERRSTFVRAVVIYRDFDSLMDKMPPSTQILHHFLKQLVHFNITANVEYFLDQYSRYHSKPPALAYRYALTVFSRNADSPNVTKLFEQYVAHYGELVTAQAWKMRAHLLHVHAKTGDVHATLVEFGKLWRKTNRRPPTHCWNILLTAYANAGDLRGCFARLKMMVERKVKLDSYSFGIIMGMCAHRGDIDTVLEALNMAKEQKVQLTTPMLDTVVEAYCSNKNMKMAEDFAESCLSIDAVGSKVRMWNVLLWNYAFEMDLESISRIRSRIDAAGIRPDDMTYAAFLTSLVLLRQTDSARRILRTLSRNGQLHAAQLHYVLILYGYVRERNRDMVHIILREINERFGQSGPGAHFLHLMSQLQRDLRLTHEAQEEEGGLNLSAVHFTHAERLLADIIKEFNPTQLVKVFHKFSAHRLPRATAYPANYYDGLIAQYAKKGNLERVGTLFNEYAKARGLSVEAAREKAPLSLISNLMLAHLKADEFEKVDDCWRIAYRQALKLGKPLTERYWNPQGTSSATTRPRLLPAYRFELSRPLTLYMRSLTYRNMVTRIDDVLAEVEADGFSLTTYNWSTFVQMLAATDSPANILRAFTIFEQKFMPSFPGWNHFRNAHGFKHSGVTAAIDLMEKRRPKPRGMLGPRGRKYWSKRYPEFMQPTYVTLVYLAAALLRVRDNSITVGTAELSALNDAAPNTIAAIAAMPRLKEKFQGVLLRGRTERWDSVYPEEERFVWTGGVLGVGGRRRLPNAAKRIDPLTTGLPPGADADDAETHQSEQPSWLTVDSEDAFDLQAESALFTGREVPTDEPLDDASLSDDLLDEIPKPDVAEQADEIISELGQHDASEAHEQLHELPEEEEDIHPLTSEPYNRSEPADQQPELPGAYQQPHDASEEGQVQNHPELGLSEELHQKANELTGQQGETLESKPDDTSKRDESP